MKIIHFIHKLKIMNKRCKDCVNWVELPNQDYGECKLRVCDGNYFIRNIIAPYTNARFSCINIEPKEQ